MRGLIAAAYLAFAPIAAARPGEETCSPPAPGERAVPGFDEATGRDLWTYPPHPLVDFEHMKLEIDIPDMNVPRLSAVQTLRVRAVGAAVATLALDARMLDVKSVVCKGRQVKFANDGGHLEMTFDPPLSPEPAEIVTTYQVNDPATGLIWTPESPAWPGRPAQIHTQGESNTNSSWFPCHDFPNVRLTTELIVTVPEGFEVSANGRMVGPVRHSEGGGSGARDTFHWLQDKPHVNYLVSMVVGRFDVVDVAPSGAPPMPVYVPPGRGKDVERTYGRTGKMVELFGGLTGQPYPWDRYAQLVVWNFGAGGMENTSATTLFDTAVLSADAVADGIDQDGLIAHELAHQWFGDLITCRSWEHIWLNEGFATYFSNLWFEHRDGADAYLAGVRGNFDSVGGDHADAPYQRAMVSKDYRTPGETFGGPANPYPKGSAILHMLRVNLGDELFFRGLAEYVAKYKFKTAETSDLRRVMEDVSGESLDRFFRQWCERPGVPDLDVDVSWDAAAKEVVVAVRQMQNIDGDNPAFAFDLPVYVDEPGAATAIGKKAGASGRRIGSVWCETRETTARFKRETQPRMVAIDPGLAVLARMSIHEPVAWWLEQLDLAPTWASRVQAARALGEDRSPEGTKALLGMAENRRIEARARAEAVKALAARRDAAALAGLCGTKGLGREVELELVEAGAALGADEKIESGARSTLKAFVASRAGAETGQTVRAASVRALGKMKAVDRLDLVLAAANVNSQHDRVRQAALEALADLDRAEGLPVAIKYAQPGSLNRTRPVAMATVAALAHHDRSAAFAALAGQLADRESRAWHAAGEGLVKVGDLKAIPALEPLLEVKRDEADLKQVHDWLEALKKKSESSGG